MALLLGFVVGAILSCCTYHQEVDHYIDFVYWTKDDGLSKHNHDIFKIEQ